ncbi:LLM class flavin-dependent oxidoreductase [Rhodovastum atsumiense]|uniref:LLM class flavin-dependent oxidoreductase n=1 Tax=Rhodovastum atsumiense TaxID=504468 RepID=A0A5M6J2L4_9PROT|nr:LLM class flavin-dependent oxidoreductase [Rhodovastum atsumiense]KAA5613838.1 LLM class flavin-dependent oxidoreductase [Rhodovastum atsumiense]CAH2601948.1 LLM class flavin-dependent oxidoreductase [Rhodovastum atsumiense]
MSQRGPLDFPDSPLSRAIRQPLMLGLFLSLQDIHVSTLPNSSSWTYDYNAAIVQKADALGFDIAFSRTQWLPKGGYDGEASLDSFVALGAMAPATRNILLISTLHVLYGPWHPLHIAKLGATFDHIAKGRWGINIVTGHRAVEHEMFGWTRIEHDRRYEMAAELFEVLQRLWTDTENYSHDSRLSSWKLKDGYITPKPLYGRPILVTATGSEAGIEFAAAHSDLVFITSPGGAHIDSALETLPAHVARIKDRARARGREVKTIINPIVISRETEAETRAYLDAIVAHKIPPNSTSFGHRGYDSDAVAWKGRDDPRHKQGYGLGGNIEVIGTPEQVVAQFAALKRAGIDGVQLNFYDFAPDFDRFAATTLPLLREAGLRL